MKVMDAYSISFLIIIFGIININGQGLEGLVENGTWPSPQAASLGNYVDVPVSYHTGVPNISIPITTISEGNISLPISLSYHAGGVKGSEVASWVGLGWTLNAGGMINRSMNGGPDEGYEQADGSPLGYWVEGGTLDITDATYGTGGLYSNILGTECLVGDLCDILDGEADSQPDIFSFNFNGYSGKFWISYTGEVNLVPKQDLRIRRLYGNEGGYVKDLYFEITTPDGVKYIFGYDPDTNTKATGLSLTVQDPLNTGRPQPDSWYLTKIVSPTGNHSISLEYERERYYYKNLKSRQATVGLSSNGLSTGPIFGNPSYIEYSFVDFFTPRLTRISNQTGTQIIDFIATIDRDDIENDTRSQAFNALADYKGCKRLEELKIQEGSFCKKLKFNYDYWVGESEAGGKESDYKRLRLDKIDVESCVSGETIPSYTFEYYKNGSNPNYLPSRITRAIDHWGYFNGQNQNDKGPSVLSIPTVNDFIIDENGIARSVKYNTNYLPYEAVNRESNETHMKYGTIKKINLPTGGYHEFEFEANTFYGTYLDAPKEYRFDAPEFVPSGRYSKIFNFSSRQEIEDIMFYTSVNKPANYDQDQLCNGSSCNECFLFEMRIVGGISFQILVPEMVLRYGVSCNNISNGPYNSLLKPLSDLSFADRIPLNTDIRFELFSQSAYNAMTFIEPPEVVMDNKQVGGLRIKKITIDDLGKTQIVTSYSYDHKLISGRSSGVLYAEPRYWYAWPTVFENTAGLPSDIMRVFFEQSLIPLSSMDGRHIAYENVEEVIKGLGGRTTYEYFIEPAINFLPTDYPYTPRQLNAQTGNMRQSNHYRGGFPIQYTINEPLDESYEVSTEQMIMATTHELKTQGMSDGVPDKYVIHIIKPYSHRTRAYRLENVNSTLDGVTTTTTYDYGAAGGILAPSAMTFSGPNGQRTTTYKYAHGTGNQALIDAFMVTIPLETLVEGGKGGGSKIEFQPLGDGQDLIIRPHKVYSANDDGSWRLLSEVVNYTSDPYMFPKTVRTLANAGFEEEYMWEPFGAIKQRKYQGRTWDYTFYPGSKLLQSVSDHQKIVSNFTYDPLMRLETSETNNGDILHTYDYQYQTNYIEDILSFSDGTTGFTSKQEIDGLGRPSKLTKQTFTHDGNDYVSGVTYDDQGRVKTDYDPNKGGADDLTYYPSPLNRLQKIKPAGANKDISFEYTSDGTNYIKKTTDENGITTEVHTDIFGNTVKSITPAGTTTYTYNDRDQVTDIENGIGQHYIYEYDNEARLMKKTIPQHGDYQYTYDSWDQIETETRPDGKVLTYVYDPTYYDFQTELKLDGATVATYDGDKVNGWVENKNLDIISSGGGSVAYDYAHDALGRVEKETITHIDGSTTVMDNIYDDASNLTQMTRTPMGQANAPNVVYDYIYDKSVRLDHINMKVGGLSEIICQNQFHDNEWLEWKEIGNNLQRINYGYQARGWLTKINSVQNMPEVNCDSVIPMPTADDINDNIMESGPLSPSLMELPQCDKEGSELVIQIMYNCDKLTEGKATSVVIDVNEIRYVNGHVSGGQHYVVNLPVYSSDYVETVFTHSEELVLIDTYDDQILADLVNEKIGECYEDAGIITTDLPENIEDEVGNTKDLFAMELHYEDGNPGLNGPSDYVGNISWIKWRSADSPIQYYGFEYDTDYRLKKATYDSEGSDCIIEPIPAGAYNVSIGGYDAVGNIMSLSRGGLTSKLEEPRSWGSVDNMSYAYIGNQVTKIMETGNADKSLRGNADFTYDGVGNMTSRSDIGLGAGYNYLFLPDSIVTAFGKVINYYDAEGTKHQEDAVQNNVVTKTLYYAGMEYKNGDIQAIYHNEGRYAYLYDEDGNREGDPYHEYNIKDHLGNVRVRFADKDNNGSITVSTTDEEANEFFGSYHYYPFGMTMEGNSLDFSGVDNRYKYNGKEEVLGEKLDADGNEIPSLGWLDYGARFYDPAIGRFTGVDPISDQFAHVSTYNYAENSPITFIDLWGLQKVHNDWIRLEVNTNVNVGQFGGSIKTLGTKFGLSGNLGRRDLINLNFSLGSNSGFNGNVSFQGIEEAPAQLGVGGGLGFGYSANITGTLEQGITTESTTSLGLFNLNTTSFSKNGITESSDANSSVSIFGISGGVGIIGAGIEADVVFPSAKVPENFMELMEMAKVQSESIMQDNTRVAPPPLPINNGQQFNADDPDGKKFDAWLKRSLNQ